jgi:hypothetical protein
MRYQATWLGLAWEPTKDDGCSMFNLSTSLHIVPNVLISCLMWKGEQIVLNVPGAYVIYIPLWSQIWSLQDWPPMTAKATV